MSVSVGYQDWVDTPTYDAELDVAQANGLTSQTQYGPLNVNNWASVGINAQVLGSDNALFVGQWWNTEALAIPLGTRRFWLDNTSLTTLTAYWPNLGPWFTLTMTPQTSQTNLALALWRSQRQPLWPYQPATPMLIQTGNVSIGAGATSTVYSGFVWAGDAQWRWATAGQAGTLTFQSFLASSFAWVTIDTFTIAANSSARGNIVLPEGPSRIQTTNTGAGAANFVADLWPSLTGSS